MFIGVISSPTGASNAIRNSAIIEAITNIQSCRQVDFGEVFFKKTKFGKYAHLVALILKSFVHSVKARSSSTCFNESEMACNTPNFTKKIVLYMGDPYRGRKKMENNSDLFREDVL